MGHLPPLRPNGDLAVVIWRARLDKAKAAYDVSMAEFRRLSEEYRNKETPHADSGFALRRAIAVENAARRNYAEVLKKFTDLIVNGKTPPEA